MSSSELAYWPLVCFSSAYSKRCAASDIMVRGQYGIEVASRVLAIPPGGLSMGNSRRSMPPMKTQGEIEAAICEEINRFEQEYMGRGPKNLYAHLIGDLLLVRLQGVLTAAEQHLVRTLQPEKGRDLLKQVRTQLIETARPVMEAMIEEVTGVKVLSLHHDISTLTGEEVVCFTLTEPPLFRESKKK
jgi:uncharacterized protein YbcI